jgi:hypothetical protein
MRMHGRDHRFPKEQEHVIRLAVMQQKKWGRMSGEDLTRAQLAGPWRELALQRGYRSGAVLPLRDESQHTFGILAIYSTRPHALTADEMRLLEDLAENPVQPSGAAGGV